MKAIRDPVHNIIHFDKNADAVLLDLIDTPQFQRLRHIKQLGLSTFTYPGAEHTRFAHSIGVAHLMKRFIERICTHKEKRFQKYIEELVDCRNLALTAALLHDIGHGPFSHALENTTNIRHEKWTIEIIRGNTEINQVLRKHGINPDEVADIIQRTHPSKTIVKLLSSQLDTDRSDYLLRDSKMTGAGYGSFDLEWLINVLRLGEHYGEIEVGLDRNKGLSIAEDFVMARYYMYINVYFHKTTRCAELIVDRIFKRALELFHQGQIDLPQDLISVLENKGTLGEVLSHYLQLTDHTIWHYIHVWSKHQDPVLSDFCARLLNRDFFKMVSVEEMDDMEMYEKVTELSAKLNLPMKYLLLKDEAKNSSYKDSYLFQKPKTDETPDEREASEHILLFDSKGKGAELSQVSDIINAIRIKPISIRRYFMPVQYIQSIVGG